MREVTSESVRDMEWRTHQCVLSYHTLGKAWLNSARLLSILRSGADLEGVHPAHAPCSPFYERQNINLRPPPLRFNLIIYTVAPPGSIFSGSAPEDINPCSLYTAFMRNPK